MKKYSKIDYTKVELPEELLTSFAKALAPEIRKFYDSDDGKSYFEKWLAKHTEYHQRTFHKGCLSVYQAFRNERSGNKPLYYAPHLL